MGDIMRPVPFKELIWRIFSEYQSNQSIFGILESQFFKKSTDNTVTVFGESCDSAIGPAAGPHTQLAQNIIASYLTGGRFFELKTIQILDTLEIEKPCIDAEDECYNTEWSSEYTVPKAYDEYVKAWIILYVIEALFELKVGKEKSFVFNMSVGYNLEGIKNPKIDRFINDLMESKDNPLFQQYLTELDSLISAGSFLENSGLENKLPLLKDITAGISSKICNQVTLSTMHGCPPDEIEAICMYMLTEKKINTLVKLNPTLLGFPTVRKILNDLGFDYVELSEESFSHDLTYPDAVSMLKRLIATSQQENLQFGVKLTNTLGSLNQKGALPGNEMYLSGRALFPLSINVGAKLSEDFNGELPISFSGGASQYNIKEIFATGIRPITLVTDMLRPGGYLRMKEMADLLEKSSHWNKKKIDLSKINKLAEESLKSDYSQKQWRGYDKVEIDKPLALLDCYAAPCVTACPINQDIPEYVKLVSQKKYKEALEVIYERNALPSITGYICDHQCMYNCTRLDYEGSVAIRDMKKLAVHNGFDAYKSGWQQPVKSNEAKIAIVGAGPAGLSAAYFLAREGFPVSILEKRESAGGVVRHIIPQFRIPEAAILHDIDFVQAHGVDIQYGINADFNLADIKKQGYKYILLAIGAEANKAFPLKGQNNNIIPALQFLDAYHQDPNKQAIGKNVVVVGGGNSAMDSARAAKQVPGVETVTVVYRRTVNEMPADREEYEEALHDGIVFKFLTNPEGFDSDGTLKCRVMMLGEPDASGRRRPVASDDTIEFKADTVLTAIGENVDVGVLSKSGLAMDASGWPQVEEQTLETPEPEVFLIGDAHTGPSTIVQCINEARKAADTICKKENPDWNRDKSFKTAADPRQIQNIADRKGLLNPSLDPDNAEAFAAAEGQRCLECNYVCNKCVDVCPNRANMIIQSPNGLNLQDPYQIVHIDAYCNECGNCASFCPYNGKPYIDKLTVFSLEADFNNSQNNGFYILDNRIKLRLNSTIHELSFKQDGSISGNGKGIDGMNNITAIIRHIHDNYGFILRPVEK